MKLLPSYKAIVLWDNASFPILWVGSIEQAGKSTTDEKHPKKAFTGSGTEPNIRTLQLPYCSVFL